MNDDRHDETKQPDHKEADELRNGAATAQQRDVLVDFSMTPLDKGASVSRYVARSLDIVAGSGLHYRLGPMGTTLEGTWEECMAVIHQCFEAMRSDCERITASIKVDYRKGRQGRLETKIASVQQKARRNLRT